MPTLLGLNDFTLRSWVLGELDGGKTPIEAGGLVNSFIAGAGAEGEGQFDPAIAARGNKNAIVGDDAIRVEVTAVAHGNSQFGKGNATGCRVNPSGGQLSQIVTRGSAVRIAECGNTDILGQVRATAQLEIGVDDVDVNGAVVMHIDFARDCIVTGCPICWGNPNRIQGLCRGWPADGAETDVEFG